MLPRHAAWSRALHSCAIAAVVAVLAVPSLTAQGVTTAAMSGIVADNAGNPLENAIVTAVHEPSGTSYRATARAGGAYTILNMRVGGPYRVTASLIGYQPGTQTQVQLTLTQTLRLDFALVAQAVQVAGIEVQAERDPLLNAGRTGAATFINEDVVAVMPTVKRSTRDLTRLDPRSDGNFAFGGRNWLYNNITVDGSYFNNSFGLDDPAPGGQTGAEPLPYDAVEQVQVSVAPFDVRQSGFTGANINMVTRSGTNQVRGTGYAFWRNDALQGNTVAGQQVAANPSLSYIQSGFSISGPLMRNKLFLFVSAEMERTDNPGSDFVACTTVCTGTLPLGVSRVRASTMDSIRQRMQTVYGYDPGPYQGFIHEMDNNKLLARLDWNINENTNFTFRYNYLDASRDLPPHPFAISYFGTGRGPNATTLPFQNSGYAINNSINSFAVELNNRATGWANRFFASYNRRRDHRTPFSPVPFPTIEIGEGGVTYTTVGHEPFSIHNILNTDEIQVTDEFSMYRGRHTITLGAAFERFSFFNSFNLFRYGLFGFANAFDSPADFFAATDPSNPANFPGMVPPAGTPYKGEDIALGQFSVYAQDELLATPRLNLTFGVRVDAPMYFTEPVDNPFSRSLNALDEDGNPETVDQSQLPGTKMLFSPRVGFNWNARGDRATQVRGGTGVFTGRVPFVWVGNVISNPGNNPNLYPNSSTRVPTGSPGDSSILQTSFDLNGIDPDFRFPQIWTTDLAVDHRLPWELLGSLEFIYAKDLNAVVMRNADLPNPTGTSPVDGRPTYSSTELNPDGAGIYVLDNTSEGSSFTLTAQLRRNFGANLSTSLAYTYLYARNNLKSTEIASVLWQSQPVQGNPNRPELGYSEFGMPHRIIGGATYSHDWSPSLRTQIGFFLQVAQGNTIQVGRDGGNRYSFRYAGDVNGDGQGGNDLLYIPRDQTEIVFDNCATACGANTTPAQQWAAFDAFINQDKYLSSHRGQIAERHGAVGPWFHSLDMRILQDIGMRSGHRLQLSLDIMNLTNLISSDWGVRKVASSSATSPLALTQIDVNGVPHFNFTGPATTYINDPYASSRWQMQLGIRYLFH